MNALEWHYYMPPNIQESNDGHWRIYRGESGYLLSSRTLERAGYRIILRNKSEAACKARAQAEQEGDDDERGAP